MIGNIIPNMIHIVATEQFYGGESMTIFPTMEKAVRYQKSLGSLKSIIRSMSLFTPINYADRTVYLIGYADKNQVVITTPQNGFEMMQLVPIHHTTAPYCTTTLQPITQDNLLVNNFNTLKDNVKSIFSAPTPLKSELPKPNESKEFNLGNWLSNLFWGKGKDKVE